jgi:hypothetical protein
MRNTTKRLDPSDFPSLDTDQVEDHRLSIEDLRDLVPALKEAGRNRVMNDYYERSGYDDEGR